MAVKLRLLRMGAKKAPFYRIVAADSRAPRDGRFIELLGTYDPRTNPAKVTIKEEEVLKWLNNGAQPSDTVKNLLSKQGIMKKFADFPAFCKAHQPFARTSVSIPSRTACTSACASSNVFSREKLTRMEESAC